jgi:hypothetical protein
MVWPTIEFWGRTGRRDAAPKVQRATHLGPSFCADAKTRLLGDHTLDTVDTEDTERKYYEVRRSTLKALTDCGYPISNLSTPQRREVNRLGSQEKYRR